MNKSSEDEEDEQEEKNDNDSITNNNNESINKNNNVINLFKKFANILMENINQIIFDIKNKNDNILPIKEVEEKEIENNEKEEDFDFKDNLKIENNDELKTTKENEENKGKNQKRIE